MTMTPSSFIWYELATDDADAACRFYGAVIGWSCRDSGTPGIDYRLLSIADVSVGGVMTIKPDAAARGMRPIWLGYLGVADVDRTVAAAVAAGGAVQMPATDLPEIGRIAMITDPQGAPIYVMTPRGGGSSPAFAMGKPGHGGWHELHTSNWHAALEFYAAHFGWAKSDALDMGPMGTYLLFDTGGDAIGGMLNDPQFPRPAWLYYFNVEDIAAARGRVEAAGGTILREPHEVPGGAWILQGRDPQGAVFALVAPPKP